jgi:hypothetical protein
MPRRWSALFAVLALAAPGCGGTPPPGGAEVKLDVVKYDGLLAAVKVHRGRVVVVDVWAEY